MAGNDVASNDGTNISATFKAPVEDEITWESDDEGAQDESTAVPKETVQVSPVFGKRTRSDSDLEGGVTERNGRRRTLSSPQL